ncbi:MAG: hypothetical protein MJZ34_14700, partial [Paludibacteraceae bacterium]|nr:hypothetical protein [Paludibacteraceae bacterium]
MFLGDGYGLAKKVNKSTFIPNAGNVLLKCNTKSKKSPHNKIPSGRVFPAAHPSLAPFDTPFPS